MNLQKESPTAIGLDTSLLLTKNNSNTDKPKRKKLNPDCKTGRILQALIDGQSLTRFDAARLHHDTCLNSTISSIQQQYGISIHRQSEKVPCVNNTKTVDCCRYSLLPSEIPKAKALLGVEV